MPVLPTVIMVLDWCVFRSIFVTAAVRIWPSITTVVTAYPITWFISTVIFLYYLLKGDWTENKLFPGTDAAIFPYEGLKLFKNSNISLFRGLIERSV